jgi:vancomycin resistance protein YoaR
MGVKFQYFVIKDKNSKQNSLFAAFGADVPKNHPLALVYKEIFDCEITKKPLKSSLQNESLTPIMYLTNSLFGEQTKSLTRRNQNEKESVDSCHTSVIIDTGFISMQQSIGEIGRANGFNSG